MTEEILDLMVGDPNSEISDVDVKQNTGPLGGNLVGIIALLGLGGFLAFFTDFFDIIIDFITGLF